MRIEKLVVGVGARDCTGSCVLGSIPFGGVHRGLEISIISFVVASHAARSRTSSLVGRTRAFASSITSISAVSSFGADGDHSDADTDGVCKQPVSARNAIAPSA